MSRIQSAWKWITGAVSSRGEAISLSLRRWDAAKTDRLNSSQWSTANGNPLNLDLRENLETLRMRAEKEIDRNPILAGVINTHMLDVVGPDGPTLQVQSDNDPYNTELEQIWSDWAQNPDFLRQLSLVDILQLFMRQLWSCGEFIEQIVYDPDVPAREISLRLHGIHPRRLRDSIAGGYSPRASQGIERDKWGRPTIYHIEDWETDEQIGFGHPKPVAASDILHGYRHHERGQIRGIPWCAPSLQSSADLRDYDVQVLDAARSAADHSVLLQSDHPDAQFLSVNESTTTERRQIRTLPPGWKAVQMQGTQPGPQYTSFRGERLREIGRPVNMPLMMVMLDSSNHNYSSARFDGQLYNRGNRSIQSWLSRIALNRLLGLVRREAELLGMIRPMKQRVVYAWGWPVPPHVDPAKEAIAAQIGFENGTLTLRDWADANGKDWEQIIVQRQRERERLVKAGLLPESLSGENGETPAAKRALFESLLVEMMADHSRQRQNAGSVN